MAVSIIIPVFNLWDYTKACLESLAVATPQDGPEIIVVDNGSTDQTASGLEALGHATFGEKFKAIRPGANLGFAKGCNLGAAHATGDALFFLNNDTTATPGWLAPLEAALQNPSCGAAGPLLLFPNGTVQHCGVYFNPLKQHGHLYQAFPGDHPWIKRKRPLQAITGAALMIRKDLFAKIGGFCEDYLNGWEDLDLCFNVRSLGYKLAVVPESVIFHHTSMSQGRFDSEQSNAAIFSARWGSQIKPDLHLLARLDGAEVKMDAGLRCWLGIDADAATKLARQAENAPPSQLEELAEANPLWPEGWLALANAREACGDSGGVKKACLRGLEFSPSPFLRAKLAAMGVTEGNVRSIPRYGFADLPGAPPDRAAEFIKHARAEGRRNRDSLLTAIYDNWLMTNQGSGTAQSNS